MARFNFEGKNLPAGAASAAERYAEELQKNGGKLLLSGVSERVRRQLIDTETTDTIAEDDIFLVTPVIGESSRAALETARV
jgi:hypothetical protein